MPKLLLVNKILLNPIGMRYRGAIAKPEFENQP